MAEFSGCERAGRQSSGQAGALVRELARRAPSDSAPSLAQQMSGSTEPNPDHVPNPQSVPAITRSEPTMSAYL
jgi:hypothetical protein